MRFTLKSLLALLIAAAVVSAIAVPVYVGSRARGRSTVAPQAHLRVIAAAENDFRLNDRDRNGVNDFWTADVYALYGMWPAHEDRPFPQGVDGGPHLGLIPSYLADADAQSRGTEYTRAHFREPSAYAGYWYRMCASHDAAGGARTLLNDTDGPHGYGAVHDATRYAVMAFPDTLASGKAAYVMDQSGVVWRAMLPAGYAATVRTPPDSDTTSTITGTGYAGLDDAAVYPRHPESLGLTRDR